MTFDGVFVLRIIEKLLIIYFVSYMIIDLSLFVFALFNFRKRRPSKIKNHPYQNYPISIIVPSYNEEVSIIACTEMLLNVDYPNFELILVNDGSSDNTMELLKQHYRLEAIPVSETQHLVTHKTRNVYRVVGKNLLIIDKENGGKADSINSGINWSSGDFICTIDADSILDKNALKEVVNPFIENERTIVSGGQLAVANEVIIENNEVVSLKTPRNIWVIWQIGEYLKSFMISRLGLSKINALLIMSGAFSLFRKQDLIEIGGFLTPINTHPYIVENIGIGKQTVCEDMEIVVRLWKYKKDNGINAKAIFLAEPVCWTEVPEEGKNLFKQRVRWHQGLSETLKIHWNMILEPKYGVTGMVALPYYFFFQLLSPIMKGLAIVVVTISLLTRTINYQRMLLLIISVFLITAIIMSSITVIIEYWSQKKYPANKNALRYKGFGGWSWLIFANIFGELTYAVYKFVAQLKGIYNFLRRKNEWNKFERKGIRKV
ncbi:MAG: glycosyltransferase family 2 protein [Bacteroidetes bacterium]|nr:glycosyltransferase family 2 protein [Bacteroidota bacterium]